MDKKKTFRHLLLFLLIVYAFWGLLDSSVDCAPWCHFEKAEQVQNELNRHVPNGTSLEELEAYLASSKLECSNFRKGEIFCFAEGDSGYFYMRKRWLIEFHINHSRLESVLIKFEAIAL